jgi:hypothetical protein
MSNVNLKNQALIDVRAVESGNVVDGPKIRAVLHNYYEASGGCGSIKALKAWASSPDTPPKLHHEIEAALAHGGPTELDLAKAGTAGLKMELQIAQKLNEERACMLSQQRQVTHKLRSRVAELQSQLVMLDPDGSLTAHAEGTIHNAKLSEQYWRERFGALTSGLEDLCESMDWKLILNPEEEER